MAAIETTAQIIRNHLAHGEWRLARAALAGALEEERTGELLALRARAEVRLGRPELALSLAEDARGMGYEAVEGLVAWTECLVAMGQAPVARAALSELGELSDAEEIPVRIALSEAHRAAGDPERGLGAASRALAFAERLRGGTHLETAEALHQLGVCLHGAGQAQAARTAVTRALAIRRVQAPDTPLVALSLDALGRIRRKEGEPFEAVELHREALALWQRGTGSQASPVSACRHSLAQALHNTGDFLAARDEMAEAWLLTARTLGAGHVDTLITGFELGRFELDIGQVEEGLHRMQENRDQVADRLGREHPVVRAMDRWL